ncbi:MAG TPA: MoxR family ATPase [Polyangiaceae bacterium]|nr:MoxR family ATPase [Polyangiaceae bacterium]
MRARLAALDYIADEALSVSVFLASRLGRPLLVEGAPGVGKTELAKVVSRMLGADLIRLQCYEGLDLARAAYEWNYPRQLLDIQARGAAGRSAPGAAAATGVAAAPGAASGPVADLFSEEYLLRRPLLDAIDPRRDRAPVLLIDELDRADEEFESFLLELLSDFQITIPELGTVRAAHRPFVLLTSNRTREVHDALKRRCLYQWIDYPNPEKEKQILERKVPGLGDALGRQIVAFSARLRGAGLYKAPGVAESIDWARALELLGVRELCLDDVHSTLGCLVKHQDDVERLRGGLARELLEADSVPANSQAGNSIAGSSIAGSGA